MLKNLNNLNEDWEYNEWPDVDLDGNIIPSQKTVKSLALQEKLCGKKNKKAVKEEVCPDCGKKVCECDKLNEAAEESDTDLFDQVQKVLDPIFCPEDAEDDECVPVEEVADILLQYIGDEGAEYLKSKLCPECEYDKAELDEPEEELTECGNGSCVNGDDEQLNEKRSGGNATSKIKSIVNSWLKESASEADDSRPSIKKAINSWNTDDDAPKSAQQSSSDSDAAQDAIDKAVDHVIDFWDSQYPEDSDDPLTEVDNAIIQIIERWCFEPDTLAELESEIKFAFRGGWWSDEDPRAVRAKSLSPDMAEKERKINAAVHSWFGNKMNSIGWKPMPLEKTILAILHSKKDADDLWLKENVDAGSKDDFTDGSFIDDESSPTDFDDESSPTDFDDEAVAKITAVVNSWAR